MGFSCNMSEVWGTQERAVLVRPERGMRARSQRSWGASVVMIFSWLMGSKEPFVAPPDREGVALCSLT